MKQVPTVPQLNLPYRDEAVVDRVLGKKRKCVPDFDPIDFSECQLAKAFPNYVDFLEEIYIQRSRQKAGGSLAHPRALRPLHGQGKMQKYDAPPWADGPSVGDVNRAYKTTDRGR